MRPILALCCLCLCHSANPAVIAVGGLGNVSCGKILETLIDRESQIRLAEYTRGYITAYNKYNPSHQITFPDLESITAYARKGCAEQPLKDYIVVVWAMVDELKLQPAP